MTISLNPKGAANARALIAAGAVDKASSWKHSAHEGAEWYLGINFVQPPAAQSHYAYPFGKGGKVFRSAIATAKDRALRNGDAEIVSEAGALLLLVDKPVPMVAVQVAAAKVTPTPDVTASVHPRIPSQPIPIERPAVPPWTAVKPKDAV